MIQLMCELNAGIRSAEEEGWISEDDFRSHFKNRRNDMIEILKDKKVIFFDVGYTLDYPLSGDWMFTDKFYKLAGDKLNQYSSDEIQSARNKSLEYLERNHLVRTVEEEYDQFIYFYSEISESLALCLMEDEIKELAFDRTYNMNNYVAYPDAKKVLKELCKSYKLGIISDTWPSIEQQLCSFGVAEFFSTYTYSCFLGTFKPDERMYRDALNKCGVPASDTVFIDDSLQNLEGAAKLGITPILIAANPASDVESPYLKIHALSELL